MGGSEKHNPREDDAFLRKVIWFLGAAFLSSAGGWIWTVAVTQTQVRANTEAVKKIEKLHKTMTDIRVSVGRLVEMKMASNIMMRKQGKKQDAFEKRQIYIFGEQKKRGPRFKTFDHHIENDRRHK